MFRKHSSRFCLTCYWTLLALVLVISQSGCRSIQQWRDNGFKVGPNYCRPAASLEMEWIDLQKDERLSVDDPDVASWWHSLNDPVLNELIDSAYSENLTLKQACARIKQAEAIRGVAAGSLFPQVQQAVGGFQQIHNSANVAVVSPETTFNVSFLGMQAAWELDFWGRYRRSVAAADANLDASIADYDDVAVILLSNVAATYVEIRLLQQRLKLTRQNVERQKGSFKIADARAKAGQTNRIDAIQAQNNIDQTESFIPVIEAQLRVANNRLCVLLGAAPFNLVSELPEGNVPEIANNVRVGIPCELLRRRPDLRRSERLMKAQSERIGIAEADLYPRISLLGSFEWQAESLSNLFEPASLFSLIGPSFSWNILNYGRILNLIEAERALFEERVYQYQQNVLTAQQEVEDSIASFLKTQEQVVSLARAVKQADEAEVIGLTLYRTGAIDFNRIFVIQATQFVQQDELAVASANKVLRLIQLYRSLGGGWQIRCGEVSSLPLAENSEAPPEVGDEKPNPANSADAKPETNKESGTSSRRIPQ